MTSNSGGWSTDLGSTRDHPAHLGPRLHARGGDVARLGRGGGRWRVGTPPLPRLLFAPLPLEVERAQLEGEHLPTGVASAATRNADRPAPAPPPAAVTLDAAEREMILQALARAGHNKSKAARLLGLTRAHLRSRIEKHGLTTPG
jgi:transcriptional regulator with AAA-type ATPase domain